MSQKSERWADKQWHERQRIEDENLRMRQYGRDRGHDQVENPENVPGDSQRERVPPTFGDGEAHEWRDQAGQEVSHGRRNRKAGRQDAVVEKWVQEQESCNSVGLRPDEPGRRHRAVERAHRLRREKQRHRDEDRAKTDSETDRPSVDLRKREIRAVSGHDRYSQPDRQKSADEQRRRHTHAWVKRAPLSRQGRQDGVKGHHENSHREDNDGRAAQKRDGKRSSIHRSIAPSTVGFKMMAIILLGQKNVRWLRTECFDIEATLFIRATSNLISRYS